MKKLVALAGLLLPLLPFAGAQKPAHPRYVLNETNGVYRWDDAAAGWLQASQGLPVPLFHRTEGSLLRVDPADETRLYLLLNVPVNSEREERLLFGSLDSGNHWALMKDLGSDAFYTGMDIDASGGLTLQSSDGGSLAVDTSVLRYEPESQMSPASLLGDTATPPVMRELGDIDTNNIAVVEDDGAIVGREFDLSNTSFEFDPRTGSLYLKLAANRVMVSWVGVPVFNRTDPNTFQVVLLPDGTIRFNYRIVNARTGITGISNGFQTTSQPMLFSGITTLKGLAGLPIAQRFRTPDIDLVRLSQRFYQTHDDDFDGLVVFGSSDYPANIAGGSGAYFAGIRNDVYGIGISAVDGTASVGSAGRLQGIINMNSLNLFPADIAKPIPNTPDSAITILGQEWGHRFGSYVRFRDGAATSTALLGRQTAHWNYFLNSEASVMEGNDWRDDGDGNFTAMDVVRRYSRLDQYLMGLRSASEVQPLMLITGPQPLHKGTIGAFASTMGLTENAIRDATKNFGPVDQLKGFWLRVAVSSNPSTFTSVYLSNSGVNDAGEAPDTLVTPVNNLRQLASSGVGVPYEVTHIASSGPHARYFDSTTGAYTGDRVGIKGTRKDVTMASIIEIEGDRVPARGAAPTAFRHAFILVAPPGSSAKPADLVRMDAVRRGWESFFRQATDGLASVSTELQSGVSRISRQVKGRGMTSLASPGTAPSPSVGYGILEVGSDWTSGVAFLTGRDGDRVVTETAVPAIGATRRARAYVERTDRVNTGIVIAAPAGAASLSFHLRNADGSIAASASVDLPAGGQIARFLQELFPAFTFPAAFRGTMTATATSSVTMVTLRTYLNESSEFLITTTPVADLAEQTAAVTYLPHFADGSGYSTDVMLINADAGPVTGTLEWRTSSGNLIGAAARYSISGNGTQVLSSGTGTGTLQSGYVVVRADAGQTGPAVRSIIQLRQNSRVVAMTGLYPSAPAHRAQTVIDLSEGHDSGVAFLNDGTVPAAIRLTLFDGQGTALPFTSSFTLGARNQSASFVSQLFPALPRGFRGSLEISSDQPLQAATLRSTATGDRFLLAAFPVESLSLKRSDAVLYFPQIVDGGGFSSEIFILNAGANTSNSKLSLFSAQGRPIKMPFGPR